MMNEFSAQMHDQTERVHQPLPMDTHQIIAHRYHLACKHSRNKRVLEVGAGHGIAMRQMLKVSEQYIAGEFSDENVHFLRKRVDANAQVVQFDAHNLPFKANSFDIVVCLAMIYYLDFEKFLDQAKHVLTPGGRVFFCTSNKMVPGFVPAPYTSRYYTVPELAAVLNQAGFSSEFYGAFPAPGQHHELRQAKAFIKNMSKKIIGTLPGGKALWQKARAKQMGETAPLPLHFEDIKLGNEHMEHLVANKINQEHRIIYGLATLREDKY